MVIENFKNIDDYKDDFYKGLSFRQSMYALSALICGIVAFLIFALAVKLPQNICFYLAMPAALPCAAMGFLKIEGMTPAEYLKKKKAVKDTPVYHYCPEFIMDSLHPENGGIVSQTEECRQNRMEQLFLDTIDGKGGDHTE